jgi:hypothetical protein
MVEDFKQWLMSFKECPRCVKCKTFKEVCQMLKERNSLKNVCYSHLFELMYFVQTYETQLRTLKTFMQIFGLVCAFSVIRLLLLIFVGV